MMTMGNTKFSEETRKFHKALDLFWGMRPEKRLWIILMLYFGKERALKIVENTSPQEYAKTNSCPDYYWHVMASLSIDEITNPDTRNKWIKSGISTRFVWAEAPANFDCTLDELVYAVDVDSHNVSQPENSSQNIFNRRQWESIYLMEIAEIFISLSDEWYQENATWAFNVIVKWIQNHYGINSGIFMQPAEITALVGRILNAENASVYNPYAGICSYAMTIGQGCDYIGQELSLITSMIGKLNLLINERHNAKLENSIVDENWKGDNQKFDYIVSTPPFGLRTLNPEYRSAELAFLAKSSHDANIKSVGVYPASICYNGQPTYTKVRSRLVGDDILETVILLPSNVFSNTAIETVIIVVNKKKERNGSVRFIDASDCFFTEGRHNVLDIEKISERLSCVDEAKGIADISNDDIRQNEYKVYPKFYCSVDEVEFPEGYQIIELKDIIEICPSTRRFDESTGFLAKISELSNNSLDCERSVDSFEMAENLANTVKVTEPVILFSMIREIKPTFCIASPERPLFVHSNVSAYRIKEACSWVNPKYLCYELSRRVGNITNGVIPRVNREVLLKTKIGFPSFIFQDQEIVVTEAIQQSKLAKARELGLQDLIDSMKADYINEVRTRKHDMRPYLRELGSVERILRSYLSNTDMRDFKQKMNNLLDKHHTALARLSNLVDMFSEEEQFGKAEHFNLNQYFTELRRTHNPEYSGYDLSYEMDVQALNEMGLLNGKVTSKGFSILKGSIEFKYEKYDKKESLPLIANIAPVDFERIVKNILENARVHGFLNPDENIYEMEIFLSVDAKRGMYQIDFINNGTVLPFGMNKLRYGIRGEKAGKTGGTGNGGYIVKTIVEHYGGDYDVFMDGEKTVVRILLPILKQDEYDQDV